MIGHDLGTLLLEVGAGGRQAVGGKKPAAILAALLIGVNRRCRLRASLREVDEAASRTGAPVLPCRNPRLVPINEPVDYRIPLVPNARRFAAGHRVQLMLTSDDQPKDVPVSSATGTRRSAPPPATRSTPVPAAPSGADGARLTRTGASGAGAQVGEDRQHAPMSSERDATKLGWSWAGGTGWGV